MWGTLKLLRNLLVQNIMSILVLLGLVMTAYFLLARPYQLNWGATDEEIERPMPGDELDPAPAFLATRAVTIEGAPKDIWPWLIQMGYGRAGFYGYDILENLGSPRGIRSAERILPEFQHLTVGDDVPISPVARMVFHAVEPNRYLIWTGVAGSGGFTWALYPFDAGHTRLVSRIRWTHHWTQPGLLALDLFTEFTDHLAVRKVLQGIKNRVEGRAEPLIRQTTEFAIYVATLLIFLAALMLILFCRLTWKRWFAPCAAGIAWLAVWYAPLPAWVAVILEFPVLWGLHDAFRRPLPQQKA